MNMESFLDSIGDDVQLEALKALQLRWVTGKC
jgi:hypothetical protein